MGVSDRIVDLIGEHVDCVVRGGDRRVRRAGLPAAHGTPTHPHELEDSAYRVVGYLWARTGKALPYAMRRDGAQVHVQGRYTLAVDDGNAYIAAGLAGMGILWLPDYMARTHLQNGTLVRLFDDWRLDSMPMYVAFPPNRHVSLKVRVFIDWIMALMAEHAPVPLRLNAVLTTVAGPEMRRESRCGMPALPGSIRVIEARPGRRSWA